MDLQSFIQRLAPFLASWQATTFLIGEYAEEEIRDNPIFTVADGLFWLRQTAERNSIVRKLQVMKLRGQDSVPGLHTFRITEAGVQAFSRTFGLTARKRNPPCDRRLSFGIPELDKMLDCWMVACPRAIASSWQDPRERGNQSSRPNSLQKAYAKGNRASWWFLKNARKRMGAGRQFGLGSGNAPERRGTYDPLSSPPGSLGGRNHAVNPRRCTEDRRHAPRYRLSGRL
jgi:hypothetical protein